MTRASSSSAAALPFTRNVAGAGRAFRSILPLDVIGIPPGFTPTMARGIMYVGRRERSATRRLLALPAGTIENAEESSSETVCSFSTAAAFFLLLKRSASALSARAVALVPLLVISRSISAVSSTSVSVVM